MARLKWDQPTERYYETGTKMAVLYPQADDGSYSTGVAWNGITAFNESPSGADETALYADDTKYLSLRAAEEYGFTIEAYTYPDEWMSCDGSASVVPGVVVGQQSRRAFGFCIRTAIGNDVKGDSFGYKLHIIYNATASPSSRDYATINDSPEAISFSWECTTNPITMTDDLKQAACITIDSTFFTSTAAKAKLTALEDLLYGTDPAAGQSGTGTLPQLPDPEDIFDMLTA